MLDPTANVDYEPVTATLHFSKNKTDATVLVPTVHDIRTENNMSFSISITANISDEQSNIIFMPSTAMIYIIDDDGK